MGLKLQFKSSIFAVFRLIVWDFILYDKGHTAVKSLDQSLSSNDIEKAKQDFLLAMNSFMQIYNDKI